MKELKKVIEEMKKRHVTIKSLRGSPLYLNSLIKKGNGKLLDFDDPETGIHYRYAQFNTRAVKDCPFRSIGCENVCYATKGNHMFKNVIESREKAYIDSKDPEFTRRMIYSILAEKKTKRYKDNIMLIRIHESGDFYSLQYLRKWYKVWKHFKHRKDIIFIFYTKSFPFFLMLKKKEKKIINEMQRAGSLAISLSLDDTTNERQLKAYLELKKELPLCNTYYCTTDIETVKHDVVCDCENCAKCATCNHATGKTAVVKIHSASNKDIKAYNKARRKTKKAKK